MRDKAACGFERVRSIRCNSYVVSLHFKQHRETEGRIGVVIDDEESQIGIQP